MRKRVHNCITIAVGQMGHMQQTDRLQIKHTTTTHMCDLHRLRLEVSGAIWQGWLAVWDEEHIQASVQAMVLLHHAGLHRKKQGARTDGSLLLMNRSLILKDDHDQHSAAGQSICCMRHSRFVPTTDQDRHASDF
jgi:hypothetical protein